MSDDNYIQDICRTNDRIHTILVHFAIFKAADVINNKMTCLMMQQIQLLFPRKTHYCSKYVYCFDTKHTTSITSFHVNKSVENLQIMQDDACKNIAAFQFTIGQQLFYKTSAALVIPHIFPIYTFYHFHSCMCWKKYHVINNKII